MQRLRPLLVALILSACALFPATALAGQWSATATAPKPSLRLTPDERQTLVLLNNIRRAYGLPQFAVSRRLIRSSRYHSKTMMEYGYFAHDSLVSGQSWFTRLHHFMPRQVLGENIGWGAGYWSDPADMVDAWMHSPPHRKNILDPNFRLIGLGIDVGTFRGTRDAWMYTTDFAGSY